MKAEKVNKHIFEVTVTSKDCRFHNTYRTCFNGCNRKFGNDRSCREDWCPMIKEKL